MIQSKKHSGAIAIVGMAGKFPGANSTGELWKNLCAGKEAISQLNEEELEDKSAKNAGAENYIRARGILKDVDKFDAEYFGFLPREADVTDPQQRVLLECASETLEDAGQMGLRNSRTSILDFNSRADGVNDSANQDHPAGAVTD